MFCPNIWDPVKKVLAMGSRPTVIPKNDRSMVTTVANALDIGEFQLVQLAFKHWYGREMSSWEQEKYFHYVFFQGHIPPFGRHLSREVHSQGSDNNIMERPAFRHLYDLRSNILGSFYRMRFLKVAVLSFVMTLGIFVLAFYTVEFDGRCTSVFPPCLTANDLGASDTMTKLQH